MFSLISSFSLFVTREIRDSTTLIRSYCHAWLFNVKTSFTVFFSRMTVTISGFTVLVLKGLPVALSKGNKALARGSRHVFPSVRYRQTGWSSQCFMSSLISRTNYSSSRFPSPHRLSVSDAEDAAMLKDAGCKHLTSFPNVCFASSVRAF